MYCLQPFPPGMHRSVRNRLEVHACRSVEVGSCRITAELANGPTRPEADEILHARLDISSSIRFVSSKA
jgi:glutamate dehydrogenase/leucine dehydrogenase